MTTNPQAEEQSCGTENEQEEKPLGVRLVERLEVNLQRAKQDIIDYPYVFGSYVFVYGTLGLWLTYRYRCLRKAQDRVRALHAKLCKQYEEEASSSAEVVVRPVKYGSPKPPSDDSAEVVAIPVKYASPKPPSDDKVDK